MARRPQKRRPPGQRSVGRRIARVVVGLTVTAVLLGGALVVVDMGLRDFAETRAEAEITSRVPGQSTAEVTIGGFSMLQQVVTGSLDDVDATFTIPAAGLERLAANAGHRGSVSIESGGVVLATELAVLEASIPLSITLEPSLADTGHLVLTATDFGVGPDITIDLTPHIDLAALGIRVCSASMLPASFTLTDVGVEGDRLVFTAHGAGVPTSLDELSKRGQCVEPETEQDAEGEPGEPAAG